MKNIADDNFNPYALSAALENRLLTKQMRSAAEAAAAVDTGELTKTAQKPIVLPVLESVDMEDPAESLQAQFEDIAAVSGKFDPTDLTHLGTDSEIITEALSRLSFSCFIEKDAGKIVWMLNQSKRSEILRAHFRAGTLENMKSLPLPPTDLYGEYLRKIIFKTDINTGNLSSQEALVLGKVLESLAFLDIPKPDLNTVKQVTLSQKMMEDYNVLLSNGFVGRIDELKALHDFVKLPSKGKDILLYGLGGAGKTTLLAKFISEMLAQQLAPIAILDFDKPGISMEDRSWLELQMVKQVSYQYPALKEQINDLIHANRSDKQDQPIVQQESSEQKIIERSNRNIITELSYLLKNNLQDNKSFVLVLDTCEEITQLNMTSVLGSWVSDIRAFISLLDLKVIYSGRIFERDISSFEPVDKVKIDEFDPVLTRQYLSNNLGVPLKTATEISKSKLLPHRPLELKLISKLVTGKKKVSIKELEKDVVVGGKLAQELFVGIVYRRVLNRIENEDIKTLAYPGLVLRYITKDLIKKVLIPALKLKPMDDTVIDKVLVGLASYGWLAYIDPDDKDKIWHRKDLRRSMLKLMVAQGPATANRISQKAIEYFSKGDKYTDRFEAIYHGLMLMKKPARKLPYELSELQKAGEFLNADIMDLPKPASVLIKYASDGKVSSGDVYMLPDKFIGKAYDKTGQRLVKSGEFKLAYELYQRSNAKEIRAHIPEEIGNLKWEIETVAATGNWDRLLEMSVQLPGPKEPSALSRLEDYALLHQFRVTVNSFIFKRLADGFQQYLDFNKLRLRDDLTPHEYLLPYSRITSYLIWNYTRTAKSIRLKRSMRHLQHSFEKGINMAELPWRVQRNFLLLGKLGFLQRPKTFTPAPSMLKLDTEWISSLIESKLFTGSSKEKQSRDALYQVLDKLTPSKLEQSNTRKLLGTIDALSPAFKKNIGEISLARIEKYRGRGQAFLRGTNPEFREGVRYAIAESFTTRAAYKSLAGIISKVTKLNMQDLVPEEFANSIAMDPEQEMSIYIELVDRCWAMGNFLDLAYKLKPTKKLGMVRSRFHQWDKIINQLLKK